MEGDMITTGTPQVTPSLIDMISNDPILGGVKLIAEAWDAGGLYQYRDIVRQFIKGTDGFAGGFAECLCRSPPLYQGVPMFYMGDKYGHTKGGNNNTYWHDHYVSPVWSYIFLINYLETLPFIHLGSCIGQLFLLGQKREILRLAPILLPHDQIPSVCLGLEDFPMADWLQWHGHQPGKPDWSETSRFVAFSIKDETQGEIDVAFNASHMPVVVGLPEHPEYRWDPVVDTGKPAQHDFLTDELPDRVLTVHQFSHFLNSNLYPMLSYSSIILLSRPDVWKNQVQQRMYIHGRFE